MKHQGINIDKVLEDSPHSRDEMLKMVLDIQERVKVEKIEQKDFEDFWDKVDAM